MPENRKEVVYRYLNSVIPKAVLFPSDTFYIEDGDLAVSVWFENNKLHSRFIRKQTSIEVPTQINSVKAVRGIAWWWLVVAGFVGLYMGRYYYPDKSNY
jgi:hypothetical protein